MRVKGLKTVKDLVPRGKYKLLALQLIKQFMDMPDEWAEIVAKYSGEREMMRFYKSFKDVIKKNGFKCWVHKRGDKLLLHKTTNTSLL